MQIKKAGTQQSYSYGRGDIRRKNKKNAVKSKKAFGDIAKKYFMKSGAGNIICYH